MDKFSHCKNCNAVIKLGRKICSPACMREYCSRVTKARRALEIKRPNPNKKISWQEAERREMERTRAVQNFICTYRPEVI